MTPILTAYFGVVGTDIFLKIVGLGIMSVVLYALYSFFD